MKLAFDLLTNLSLHLAPHHWFEAVLTHDGAVLETTRGRDTFAYSAMLLPGEPVCATGRTACHQPQPDLNGVRGVAGIMADVPLATEDPFAGLALWIDTNRTMSQGELQTYFSLRCRFAQRDAVISLSQPVLPVHWEGQGLFKIMLDPLSDMLQPRIDGKAG